MTQDQMAVIVFGVVGGMVVFITASVCYCRWLTHKEIMAGKREATCDCYSTEEEEQD